MNPSINMLFWILPIGLIFLLIYRRISKQSSQDSDAKKLNSKKSLTILKYLMLFILLFAVFLFGLNLNDTSSKKKSNSDSEKSELIKKINYYPHIHPDTFAIMVNQNEDFIAGIFYEKNFERVLMYDDDDKKRKGYRYLFKNPVSYKNNEPELLAWGWRWSDWDGFVFYKIYKRQQYDDYFDLLKLLGAVELKKSDYKNYSEYVEDDETAYLYNNAVFNKRGFIGNEGAYVIYIFKSEFLESIGNEKNDSLSK